MKKQVYFIFATPPLESYMHRYCIDYLETHGWETHIIDLSPIINPIAYEKVKSGLVSEERREIIKNKRCFRKYMRDTLDSALFILTLDFNYDSYFIHRCIRKKQKYGYMNRMDTNVEPDKVEKTKRIVGFFKNISFQRLANSIFIRIPRNLFQIKVADFIVLGGMANRQEYINLCYAGNHTVVEHIHSLDCEKYLEIKDNTTRLVDEPYCVFLDQFLPHHPDNISAGYNINGDKYYEEMVAFFHNIEEDFHIKVIIAAHPRADYENNDRLFSDFKIFRYKTAELVKDAEFVLAHFTTSVSFAVLFQKPVIFITTNDINEINLFRVLVYKNAKLLGKKVINISGNYKKESILKQLNIDKKKYEEFCKQYIAVNIKEEHKFFATQLVELILNIESS